jgi:hypothetical protein
MKFLCANIGTLLIEFLMIQEFYGITPPVDGKYYEATQTFLFHRSNVRMLNKLKSEHENENVYLSSIVDMALKFYYRHVLGENGKVDNAKVSSNADRYMKYYHFC